MINMKYLPPFLVLFLSLTSSVYAENFSLKDLVQKHQNFELTMPTPEPDGRIQTLNRKGAASPALDYATSSFIKFAQNKKVLEVGGAYGFVMYEVLKNYPETVYHINDLDERHLYLSANNLQNQQIPLKILENQTRFISGNIANIDIKDRYDAILIARVLHFMNPEELDKTISNLYKTLKPGGRVYAVAITPYVKRFQSFIPEYEKRLREQVLYPGYAKSLYDWLNENTNSSQQKEVSDKPFMFLDDIILTKLFTQKGFKIIECRVTALSYHSEEWSLDGRENVILIAEKYSE